MRQKIRLAEPEVRCEPSRDGVIYRSAPLSGEARRVGDWLERWAREAPDRIWLAERSASGDWQTVSYAEGYRAVLGLGSALLQVSPSRPVLLLSDNSVPHALLQMAAISVGLPAAPVSPAWSLLSTDHGRLREVVRSLEPGVVFAADPDRYAAALRALSPRALWSSSDVSSLAKTEPSELSSRRAADPGPETTAKILFTSGSTATPKGVVNTQRMLCSNQAAIAQSWPFLDDRPPVVVDWLPWSHTFGGNHNFFLVLRSGGSLYIDSGKPAAPLFEATLRNLREISPTLYFNVPRGLDLLASALEGDEALRQSFFRELDLLFYAAAALPATVRARLREAARRAGRDDLFFSAAWGLTETAPMSTLVHFHSETPAAIGLPAPGTDIKLAPVDGKLEIRVRGPNVTPGYYTPSGIEPPLLDADGFLPTGDAVRLDDPEQPSRGFVFEGRLGENFKLSSGTWVRVGPLRLSLVEAMGGLVADAVIAGHDRDTLGAMFFLPQGASAGALEEIRERLLAYNAAHAGSSERIARALILTAPPSLDAGETTDKGYLNQRRILALRSSEVERLFAQPAGEGVIAL